MLILHSIAEVIKTRNNGIQSQVVPVRTVAGFFWPVWHRPKFEIVLCMHFVPPFWIAFIKQRGELSRV